MSYVDGIEPRLTPHRPVTPATTAEVLVEWTRDLEAELAARLRLLTPADLRWQPHPDSNSVGVTAWHVARWLDLLGTRIFAGAPADQDVWHRKGWRDATGYEPEGLGYLGLGSLTGYTPEEMRAVPHLDADELTIYLSQAADRLVATIRSIADEVLDEVPGLGLSPYQIIGSTLQGSFGHVGEIDALVSLHARTTAA